MYKTRTHAQMLCHTNFATLISCLAIVPPWKLRWRRLGERLVGLFFFLSVQQLGYDPVQQWPVKRERTPKWREPASRGGGGIAAIPLHGSRAREFLSCFAYRLQSRTQVWRHLQEQQHGFQYKHLWAQRAFPVLSLQAKRDDEAYSGSQWKCHLKRLIN